MLESDSEIRSYIETQDPATIASLLRHDQDLCTRGGLPSRLALFLPPANSEEARLICRHLQRTDLPEIPLPVCRIQYAGIIQGIRAHLDHVDESKGESSSFKRVEMTTVSAKDAKATRKVLGGLLRNGDVSLDTRLEDVMEMLLNYSRAVSTPEPEKKQRKCYICHLIIAIPHVFYPSLCSPCGQFNIAESSISLPQSLSLVGKTALVTGGRVNLGFHTALRLLRCGAKVAVSSRYPHDTERRYLAEKDSSTWSERLRILGADFRAAKDVFQMIKEVKEQLRLWSQRENTDDAIGDNLDILINNAAQTLTDSIQTEKQAIVREEELISGRQDLVVSSDYQPRLRGASNVPWLLDNNFERPLQLEVDSNHPASEQSSHDSTISKTAPKSSWMQNVQQIPYEDFVSAYSVNSFVPLILIRELLPVMSHSTPSMPSPNTRPSKPRAYIINVSSREGLFENLPTSSAKCGHHVHTNMSKAALNMITETEAARTWHDHRVAMNSVDPGYMSAAPEIIAAREATGQQPCPIGWEDGAGRVLWPVAKGEIYGEAVWGRFLKHFAEFEIKR